MTDERSAASFLNEGALYVISRMSDPVVIKGGQGQWIFANSEACKFFHLPEDGSWEGLSDIEISQLTPPLSESFREMFLKDERAWSERKKQDSVEIVTSRENGAVRHVRMTRIPFFSSDGNRRALVVIIHDLTDFSELQSTLREERKKIQSILDSLSDGVVVVDLSVRMKYLNYAAEQMLGYRLDEVQDKPLEGILPFVDEQNLKLSFSSPLQRFLNHTDFRDLKESYLLRRDGRKVAVEETISLLRDRDGNASGLVIMLRDATLKRELLKRLNMQAYYDNLTGAHNRGAFSERLKQSVAKALRFKNSFAVILLDLDGFKQVNDSLGHAGGDELLRMVASRLGGLLRETDTLARFGGDEFVIIQEGIENPQKGIHPFVGKISEAFDKPFSINDTNVSIGSSIGISLFPQDGQTEEQLLKSADLALYEAKKAGKNTWRYFNASLGSKVEDRIILENLLSLSPDSENLQIYYLPQVDLETGQVKSLEALLRLKKGDRILSPSVFMTVAEESGQIIPIDLWVLRTVATQIKVWHHQGFGTLKGSVNVSAQLFFDPGFVPKLKAILSELSLSAGTISVEIAEPTLGKNIQKSLSILHDLKEIGVPVILDNFGALSPSLIYLKKFPVDSIKVDSLFTNEIESDAKDKIILESLVGLGKRLDLVVCAKGVETDLEREFLLRVSCKEAQGFLFSLPLPQEDVASILRSSSSIKGAPELSGKKSPQAFPTFDSFFDF